jgi:uncharacterized membrane protein YqaE (UPF0057 family)
MSDGFGEISMTINFLHVTLAYIAGILTCAFFYFAVKHFGMRNELKEVKKTK